MDVESALDELQKLITAVETEDRTGSGSSHQITQRLRVLEEELRRSVSVRSEVQSSPSPRRHVSAARNAQGSMERAPLIPSRAAHASMKEPSVHPVDIYRSAADETDTSRAVGALNHSSNFNFSQSVLGGDDRQRLTFIIDTLSSELRRERAWRRELQHIVVPPLLARIEALEHKRDEESKLRQEMIRETHALRLQLAAQSSCTVSDIHQRFERMMSQLNDLCEAVWAEVNNKQHLRRVSW